MTGEMVEIGNIEIRLETGKYNATEGYDSPEIYYKDGNTEENCDADTWHLYSQTFVSSGYIRIRVEAP